MGPIEIHFFDSVATEPNSNGNTTEDTGVVADSSVNVVVSRFEAWLSKSSFRPSTKRAYNSRFRQFEKFAEMEKDARGDLPEFTELAKEFLSLAATESTLKHGSINCFISLFEKMARVSGLENVGFQRYEVASAEKIVLSRAQQKLYLNAADKNQSCRDKLLVLLFLRTNIRLGEAVNIKIFDLIWEQDCLKIRIAGRSGTREEIMDKSVEQSMRDWLSERSGSTLLSESQYLFPGAGGRRITTSAMDAVLRKIGWKARLNVSARLLRNTYFNRLKYEQELFGNTSNRKIDRFLSPESRAFVMKVANN